MSDRCAGIIFSGPSLPRVSVEEAGFVWRPPVRQGDVTAALVLRPTAIGIIDGVFETVPTIWHKEILAALDTGIRVYGASSIGALRAAELDVFGMVGVGAIFEAYRDGIIEDDDEVALLHGPEELGFVELTVPMVNLRATVESGRVDPAAAHAFVGACKTVFYKERSPERVQAFARIAMPHLSRPFAWLDQKRTDADTLLRAMKAAVAPHPPKGSRS